MSFIRFPEHGDRVLVEDINGSLTDEHNATVASQHKLPILLDDGVQEWQVDVAIGDVLYIDVTVYADMSTEETWIVPFEAVGRVGL